MTGTQFLVALAQLLKTNTPPAADASMLTELAAVGIISGEDFDSSKLDPTVRKALDGAVLAALAELQPAPGGVPMQTALASRPARTSCAEGKWQVRTGQNM
jgi:hypothetical protein